MQIHPQPQANPFASTVPQPPHLVTERDFAAVYAGADLAYEADLILDSHLTVLWDRLDPDGVSSPQAELTAFLKCMRAWYAAQRLSPAWIYAHECGPVVGPHTHFALSVPVVDSPWAPSYRAKFKRWAGNYCVHRTGRKIAGAVRVRMPSEPTPWLHWLNFHYLLKGYDRDAIVLDARMAPDGRPTMLGDLIAFPWRDPGPRVFRSRVGVSSAIGPGQRELGIPGRLRELGRPVTAVDPFSRAPIAAPRAPFRSRYEQGARDVRRLYPACFLDQVRRPAAKVDGAAVPVLMDLSSSLDV